MTMKHTKGPWKVEEPTLTYREWVIRDEAMNDLASVRDKYDSHLIASAPEMLEMLEEVILILSAKDIGVRPSEKLKAVIRKAKGE